MSTVADRGDDSSIATRALARHIMAAVPRGAAHSASAAMAGPSPFGECLPDVPPPLVPPLGVFSRMATLGVVAGFSKFVVSVMNTATTSGYDVLLHHMTHRVRPTGLVTVSNHSSTFDDPGVLSFLIPWTYFATEPSHGGIRWTMCTSEICAASPAVHAFFTAGKTVPINRGGGLHQATLVTMAHRIAKGDWVHIFPEGKVNPDAKELGRLKWGLGKILCDVDADGAPPPVVIPFWHSGMDQVKKYGRWGFSAFNKVHVTVGEPIDFTDLTARCKKCDSAKRKEKLYASMMRRTETAMRRTREKNNAERKEA